MIDPWVRRVLALAPREFRERWGEELLATHRARMEAAAHVEGPGAAFRLREVVGAVRLVVRLRLGLEGSANKRTTTTGRGGSMVETTWQDIRFGIRTLFRNRGYTAAAVTVLALGIGASAAIFSAVNAYFFRPLPFAEEERLVTIGEDNPEFDWVHQTAAPANLLDWREQVEAFEDVTGYSDFADQVTVFYEGEPTILRGAEVLGNFFSTLGVPPALGRTFRFEETWTGNDQVVLISHDLWVSRYGSDPNVVGRRIEFANHRPEIVGVMPEGFSFPVDGVQLWYPMGLVLEDRTATYFRRAHYIRAIARLAPGVTREQADGELQTVVRGLQEQYPETNRVMGASLRPLRQFLIGDVRATLYVLSGAVAILLLLACTNVANLTLVRAADRGREVALRHALGAGRRRVVRQMLTESVLLSLVGGALGLALGWVGVRALALTTRVGIQGATELALDHRVVLFTSVIAAGSGILFGIFPALRAMSGDLQRSLREGARGASSGPAGLRTAGFLVSVEVALAVLLVVGAGLMVRTYLSLRDADPGFEPEGVLAVQFAVQDARYPTRDDVLAFYDRFAEALEARSGVEAVGTIGQLPLYRTSWTSQFQAEGWPPDRVGFEILHRRADGGYFEALGIPLLGGRMFGPDDRADAPRVLLVNEAFVREYFPDEDPVGKRIAFDRAATPESNWWEIIGVVGDQHQESLAIPPRPEVYESRNQDWGRLVWHVVRGEGDASSLLPQVEAVLEELDPLIPIAQVRPLRGVWRDSMAREEFVLTLLTAFGILALVLAAVGVYGVTAQAARRRTREIGVRIALGAAAPDVLGLMLRQSIVVVGLGLAVGTGAALLATGVLSSLLYGVEPRDPATIASVAALLGGIALLACWLPARRATRVDPVTSLRSE